MRRQWGGPWTEIKLDVLRRYLSSWASVLKHQDWCTKIYIDAFAGTGSRFEEGGADQLELLPDRYDADWAQGSARIALQVEPRFDKLHFIEANRSRIDILRENLASRFPGRSGQMHFHPGDANEELVRLCRSTDWKRSRAVLFLDPYGMQVEWETIRVVAQTSAIDLWYLVPTAIGFGRTAVRSGLIPEKWRERMTRTLGTSDWEQDWYEPDPNPRLFPDMEARRIRTADLDAIERLFINRLKLAFDNRVAERVLRLGPPGRTLYSLVFACANPSAKAYKKALNIANHLLKAE